MTFTRSHFSTLIKYIGISFITGAISHGFFSEFRSLITGVFGVICFMIGTYLEEDGGSMKAILYGAILAIGIGSVTGWLQHFPDSPERSLLIIPIWYIISIFLFAKIHNYILKKAEYIYIAISSVVVLVGSVGIFFLIENMTIFWHSHHVNEPMVNQLNIPSITATGEILSSHIDTWDHHAH